MRWKGVREGAVGAVRKATGQSMEAFLEEVASRLKLTRRL